jgi:hypothetical protein
MSDTAGPTDIAPPPPMPPPIHPAVAVPRPRQRVRSLTPSALAWLGVAVIVGDLGLRSGLAALSSTVAIAVVAGPILGSLTRGAIERGGPRTAMFTVLTGLRIWPPMRADTWLTSLNAAAVAACLVVATLFTVNVVNPEARVAEHNLARTDAVERLDADYLMCLSADAWPALLQHELLMTGRLHSVATLRDQCDLADAANSYGLAGFNLARQRLECG